MAVKIEIYVSIDGANYKKLDLSATESINMKYVLKDTSELSKVFAPFSQSFTFPGTLNNQKALGFVGHTKVVKVKTDNIFDSKIYANGLLLQSGKLKITEVREDLGRIRSFTGNFTTSLLSLATRMGDDLISDLPTTPVELQWSPNNVLNSIQSIKLHPTQPMPGVGVKYYVPLISNNRVFNYDKNTSEPVVDNVAYNPSADPAGNNVIKSGELAPAIQFRSVIDMIKIKYNLNIVMPLENETYYNDLYIYCNGKTTESNLPVYFDIVNQFGALTPYKGLNVFHVPDPKKYTISADLSTNIFDIERQPTANNDYDKEVQFFVKLNNVTSTKGDSNISVNFILELENGAIYNQISGVKDANGDIEVRFIIPEERFVSEHFRFRIKQVANTPILWANSECKIEYKFYDGKFGPFNQTSYQYFRQSSILNNNSSSMGGTKIDLYKAIPEMKCVDFLNSFIKMFNISIFDVSPNDDRLYWLTPQDLNAENKEYSRAEVDYTPYIVSRSVVKTVPNDYNYYNFKHKTSKYKTNADYLGAKGHEFGQLTYPTIKPTENLSEFKVETAFSILEALPIPGLSSAKTSYAFTSDSPTINEAGETRYTPNNDDFTIFFAAGIQSLNLLTLPGQPPRSNRLGFQGSKVTGGIFGIPTLSTEVSVVPLESYVISSPVHPSGFSLGFGLIQESTEKSLYLYYYKAQTERLLNPNTLQHDFELQLPAKELILNFANIKAGQSNIPTGFRLQNDIVLQETRFSSIEATIDITTGKAKMKLLNY